MPAHLVQRVEVHHGGVGFNRDHLYSRTHDLVYLCVLTRQQREEEKKKYSIFTAAGGGGEEGGGENDRSANVVIPIKQVNLHDVVVKRIFIAHF